MRICSNTNKTEVLSRTIITQQYSELVKTEASTEEGAKGQESIFPNESAFYITANELCSYVPSDNKADNTADHKFDTILMRIWANANTTEVLSLTIIIQQYSELAQELKTVKTEASRDEGVKSRSNGAKGQESILPSESAHIDANELCSYVPSCYKAENTADPKCDMILMRIWSNTNTTDVLSRTIVTNSIQN
ncbi:hypothetical protein CEXT_662781 [Caerostris extrusa]|uniref:Uncharacterized protein n=1 Tax=Caerostris extrusa TaxID=172846 RepID=A0AAV4PC98_CAEEX|nr:hypothetical protein CEXT_662781 [Caerostris extrusa]